MGAKDSGGAKWNSPRMRHWQCSFCSPPQHYHKVKLVTFQHQCHLQNINFVTKFWSSCVLLSNSFLCDKLNRKYNLRWKESLLEHLQHGLCYVLTLTFTNYQLHQVFIKLHFQPCPGNEWGHIKKFPSPHIDQILESATDPYWRWRQWKSPEPIPDQSHD